MICTYRFRPVPVIVTRGSANRTGFGPGYLREVRGVALEYAGSQYAWRVRLTEDDPYATLNYCRFAGEAGWWSASCVRTA